MQEKVYIHQIDGIRYPLKEDCFSPSICYPEYYFTGEIAKTENKVYDSVRECLYKMGFDQENFGKKGWNPLKEIIQPGNVVLLKPNMVLHENKKPENGTDCLITHPSLVRAILDYVVMALKGKGTIIVGDAPLQSCDFERLMQEQGYTDIVSYYRNHGIQIELVDFRNYKTVERGGILHRVEAESLNEGVRVNLGINSEHGYLDDETAKRLRITNYSHDEMYEHHYREKNEYLIAQKVLDADVIINMPKPKTHRKAGVTISLKNLIGINTNKEWLPHHKTGSVKEGGDEYLAKSFIKKAKTYLIEKKDDYMTRGAYGKARFCKTLALGFSILSRLFLRERFYEGSWYGNDTIWRTILDLNKIVFYADRHGNIRDKKQRKMLIVADMVISGEGEGPLLPTPKNAGIIAMGLNPVCFDEAIAAIMGFSPALIPSIQKARNIKNFVIAEPKETLILSNNPAFNLKRPVDIHFKDSLQFKPSEGWKSRLLADQIIKGDEQ